MCRTKLLSIVLFILFVQCNILHKKQKPTDQEKTPQQLIAEEKARQDSIEYAALQEIQKIAFAGLLFGMNEAEVDEANPGKERLGKYNYSFVPQFNGDMELYKLTISSDEVKAIRFDSDLLTNYNNLYKILETRYGKPLLNNQFPSIFEVQNSKKFIMNKWEEGTKNIHISLVDNNLNSYAVVCDIFDKNMMESEKERLYKLKNKDVLDAAQKF